MARPHRHRVGGEPMPVQPEPAEYQFLTKINRPIQPDEDAATQAGSSTTMIMDAAAV